MSPESGFIADILADPSDRAAALIYADWLDDQGRTSEALHTRFCAQAGLRPGKSRQGTLCWWDEIEERWLGRPAVGKVWEVKAWSGIPGQRRPFLTRSALED
jgi:uncharacterized protein (TIGR02996 family)